MLLSPEQAQALLARVDPERTFKGCPVGLRDGAVLALIARGYSAVEIAALQGTHITMARGRVVITVKRNGFPLSAPLPVDLGNRVLAWLHASRLWSTSAPAFTGVLGPLTARGVCKIVERYCDKQPTRRVRRTRRRRNR